MKCNKCKTEKPLTEYVRASRIAIGRRQPCRECRNRARRDRRVDDLQWANRARERARNKPSTVAHKVQLKNDEMYRIKHNKRQASYRQKRIEKDRNGFYEKQRIADREAYAASSDRREKAYTRFKIWKKLKPERYKIAMKRGVRKYRNLKAGASGSHTDEEFREIITMQRNRCYYCGKLFTKNRPPTEDHIIPISKGGDDWIGNIVAACKHCNCSKNARSMLEFQAIISAKTGETANLF